MCQRKVKTKASGLVEILGDRWADELLKLVNIDIEGLDPLFLSSLFC